VERQRDEERLKDVRELAVGLLRQGEQCALVGLPHQAIEILCQVWTISAGCAPDVATTAAWNIGWLLAQTGQYHVAAQWFERVAHPPMSTSDLWPTARQTLMQMCDRLAQPSGHVAPIIPSVSSAWPTVVAGPSTALPLLNITSLGRFHITRAGKPLPTCKARKAIAIFRYLLLQRHHSAYKDELIELFWPNARPQDAAHSLHVAISGLRRYLDPGDGSYLLLDAGRYAINGEAPLEDDCATFVQLSDTAEQCWREGDLQGAQDAYTQAIGCYQGDYHLDDRDFLWAVAEQERLLTRYLSALDHLGRICMAQGQFDAAITCYQRLLDRDSYREDAHCQLMTCYQQLGRRGAAVRQYDACAAILAHDLDLEPMPETQALYQRIVGDTP
jgi:DNA-binding SARP family transcriptional activator